MGHMEERIGAARTSVIGRERQRRHAVFSRGLSGHCDRDAGRFLCPPKSEVSSPSRKGSVRQGSRAGRAANRMLR